MKFTHSFHKHLSANYMPSTVLGARDINSKPPRTHSLASKPSTKTDNYTITGVTDSDILVNIYQLAQGMV